VRTRSSFFRDHLVSSDSLHEPEQGVDRLVQTSFASKHVIFGPVRSHGFPSPAIYCPMSLSGDEVSKSRPKIGESGGIQTGQPSKSRPPRSGRILVLLRQRGNGYQLPMGINMPGMPNRAIKGRQPMRPAPGQCVATCRTHRGKGSTCRRANVAYSPRDSELLAVRVSGMESVSVGGVGTASSPMRTAPAASGSKPWGHCVCPSYVARRSTRSRVARRSAPSSLASWKSVRTRVACCRLAPRRSEA